MDWVVTFNWHLKLLEMYVQVEFTPVFSGVRVTRSLVLVGFVLLDL
jgi:hypothetical protein